MVGVVSATLHLKLAGLISKLLQGRGRIDPAEIKQWSKYSVLLLESFV